MSKELEVINTRYGFIWGDALVERITMNIEKPKFQLLRIFLLTGEVIEITLRARSHKIKVFPKEKPRKQRKETELFV